MLTAHRSLRRQGRLPRPRQDVHQARGRAGRLERPRRQGKGRPRGLGHLFLQALQHRRRGRGGDQHGMTRTPPLKWNQTEERTLSLSATCAVFHVLAAGSQFGCRALGRLASAAQSRQPKPCAMPVSFTCVVHARRSRPANLQEAHKAPARARSLVGSYAA